MSKQSGNMALSVLLRAVDHISAPVKGVQTRLTAFGRVAKSVGGRDDFKRLTASLKRAGKASQDLYNATGRVVRRLAMIGGGAVAGIIHTTMATAALGDNVAKTADKLGVGIERLQEMRFAADRAGVSQEAFDNSLQAFTRRVSEAAQGSGAAANALEELGLSAKELSALSPDQAMNRVADSLSGVENQSDRVRLAFDLFGREGISMVNMLKDGSTGLEDMYKRARELGVVLGTNTARTAEGFTDAMTDMRSAMLGIRTTIGGALMPIFTQWMTQLTDLVVRYQPQIQAWTKNFAAGLPGRLIQLKNGFLSLLDTIQPVINIGMSLIDHFGAVQSAIAVVSVIIGAPLIMPLISLMAALTSLATTVIPIVIGALKMLALAAMTNPILAIVMGIAIAATLLIVYWDKVAPWFSSMWTKMVGYVRDAWTNLTEWLGWDPMVVIGPIWNVLVDYFKSMLDVIKRLFTGDFSAIKEVFKWSPLGLMKTGFDAAVSYLSSIDWQAAIAAGWDLFKSVFSWSPLGLLVTAFGRVTDWFRDQDWSAHGRALLETLANGILSMASAPVDAVRNALAMTRNLLPFSDAKEGPLSELTASGRAIPNTLAVGVTAGQGSFIGAVTSVAGAARTALSNDWDAPKFNMVGNQSGDTTEPTSKPHQADQTMAMAKGGSGARVNNIDFHPAVTIQVGNNAISASDIADLIEERLERMRRKDLWVQIQRVQEATG